MKSQIQFQKLFHSIFISDVFIFIDFKVSFSKSF